MMLGKLDVSQKTILEPSAGKGDLINALKRAGAREILSCELDPQLSKIVQPISNFLTHDFLTLTKDKISHVQSIVMNPPFSHGIDHILHAWEIAPSGCEIVALCNYSNLFNDFTRSRKELQSIINLNGNYEELGDVFKNSERTTGVNVALVHLFKPVSNCDQEFEGFFMDEEPEEDNGSGLMQFNEVRNVVQRYIGTVKEFEKLKAVSETISNYVSPLGLSDGFSYSVGYDNKITTVAAFSRELQKKSWAYIISKTGMSKNVTSGVMDDINRFVEQQQKYPFTMKNIYRMLEVIVKTRSQTMDRAVIEVFDKITKHHKDNRYNVEGWKTNSHYLIGKKFIFDWVTEIGWSGELKFRYTGNQSKMTDFTKVLQFLTGDRSQVLDLYQFDNYFLKEITTETGERKTVQLKRTENLEFGKWYDWGFFTIKGFKKGTLHVKFRNPKHWELINRKVAEIKGFPLPESL